jgi:hypothetical protein
MGWLDRKLGVDGYQPIERILLLLEDQG